jgi:protein-arginine kinase activator protein McsA
MTALVTDLGLCQNCHRNKAEVTRKIATKRGVIRRNECIPCKELRAGRQYAKKSKLTRGV